MVVLGMMVTVVGVMVGMTEVVGNVTMVEASMTGIKTEAVIGIMTLLSEVRGVTRLVVDARVSMEGEVAMAILVQVGIMSREEMVGLLVKRDLFANGEHMLVEMVSVLLENMSSVLLAMVAVVMMAVVVSKVEKTLLFSFAVGKVVGMALLIPALEPSLQRGMPAPILSISSDPTDTTTTHDGLSSMLTIDEDPFSRLPFLAVLLPMVTTLSARTGKQKEALWRLETCLLQWDGCSPKGTQPLGFGCS